MEKTLKEELEQLKQELGTSAFDEHLDRMKGHDTSDADKALINEYVMQMLENIGTELHEVNKELETIQAVKSISEMISFKYIAETYFKKSKAWFSQRLNGNKVHGKVCRFSDAELDTLRFALKDISEKIGSLSI